MEEQSTLWIVLVGAIVALTTFVKAFFQRIGGPPLVGYILLGILAGALDRHFDLIGSTGDHALQFLAQMGLVLLLFRVGLESKPSALAHELPTASVIGASNLVLAAIAGFAVAYYVLGLDLIASLAVGTALTATSVGVALAPWEELGALDSRSGRILLDVAELDDIAGVILMSLLLAVIPALQNGGEHLWGTLGQTMLGYLIKFSLFALGCVLFSRYVEPSVTRWSALVEPQSGVLLTLLGLGTIIAALAGWLGFSLAIGALFAGLVFSQDPRAVHSEGSFNDLYVFFVPFFFVGIGREIELQALATSWHWGLLLLVVAAASKLLGAGLAAWPLIGGSSALLLAVSVVPRAEITMVVAQQAKQMGAVSPELYAALVLVAAGTSLGAPLVLRVLLRRTPPSRQQ